MIKQSLEIVIPAYNEEENIKAIVKESLKFLKSQTKDYNVLVVDDGSEDNTGKILDNLAKKNKHVKVIHHTKNMGIGTAWNTAYKNSTKDIIFTCPADQQFHPKDFSKTLPYLNKTDIISIYRPKKQDYNLFRLFITNTNRITNRLLFNLDIKDINWLKMFKRKFLEMDLKSKSVLIDTEILAKAKKRRAKIIQISAPYGNRVYGKSRGANIKHISQAFLELLKLYWNIKIFK